MFSECRALSGGYRADRAPDHLTGYVRATYDANRNQASVKDAKSANTEFVFDASNRLIESHRPDGSISKSIFGPDGNMASQVDGRGYATTYTFDRLGHPVTITDPLGRSTRYSYDGAGNTMTVTNPDNQTTTYTYDGANQRASTKYSSYSTGGIANVNFDYDKLGRRTTMREVRAAAADSVTTYTYDSLGRLTRHSRDGLSTEYGHDLAGRLATLGYPHRASETPSTVIRGYDAAGRLNAVTDWYSRTSTFGYDADGNLTTTGYSNGVTTSRNWDPAGRVSRIVHDNHGGKVTPTSMADRVVLDYPYSRDPDGLLTGENPTGTGAIISNAYHYDANGRLVGAGALTALAEVPTHGYGYDVADNLTSISKVGVTTPMVYDRSSQLVERWLPNGGREAFTYDSRGNRTRREIIVNEKSTGAGDVYSYDQANRLTMAGTVLQYTYDGDGLRSDLYWDLSEALPLIIGDVTSWYVTGPGGLPIEKLTLDTGLVVDGSAVTTDPTLWYHQDQLGSTNALSDAKGRFVSSYMYDPYGNATPSRTGVVNPFQYAGQYTDLQTGLIYMRARWYDPVTGQFLTRDPIEAVTRSAYGYVGGNPLNAIDPSGLAPCAHGYIAGGGCDSNGYPTPAPERRLVSEWVYRGAAISNGSDVANFAVDGATSLRLVVQDHSFNFGTISVKANGEERSRNLAVSGSATFEFLPAFGQNRWKVGAVWEPAMFYQGRLGGLVTGLFTVEVYTKKWYYVWC